MTFAHNDFYLITLCYQVHQCIKEINQQASMYSIYLLSVQHTGVVFYNQKIPESLFIAVGVRGCDRTQSLNPMSALVQFWCVIDKAYLQNCKIITYLSSVAKYVSATKVFDLAFFDIAS
jgi:hypothetical protein